MANLAAEIHFHSKPHSIRTSGSCLLSQGSGPATCAHAGKICVVFFAMQCATAQQALCASTSSSYATGGKRLTARPAMARRSRTSVRSVAALASAPAGEDCG